MFKPVSLAHGMLMYGVNAGTTQFVFSPDLYNRLAATLGEESGNTTYLLVGIASRGEVVRVDNLFQGVADVTRGMDGSVPKSFLVGEYVNYHFCAAAVADMIGEATLPVLEIIGHDGIDVQNPQAGLYVVSLAPFSIQSSNGTIDVQGTFPDYDLAVNPSAFGLCNTGITP